MKFKSGIVSSLLVYTFGLATVNAKPADFCCRIWSGENYEEPYKEGDLCLEEKSTKVRDFDLADPYTKAKSWACGKNVSYRFCNKDNVCSSGAGQSWSKKGSNKDGEKVESVKVTLEPYYVEDESVATVFSGVDCTGPFKSFASSAKEGSKTHKEIYDKGLTKMRSIYIPKGTLVEVYDKDDNKKKI